MITTDNTTLAQNIVTDVNANVPLPAEKSRTISPEAALLFNKSVVARPLMVAEVGSIKVKNLEYRYRWVNRDGQNGRIYMQRKSQGFTNATVEDVEILGGEVMAKDGEIRVGDLVLMKIQANLYDAAIKWNMSKALTMARTRGVFLEGASSDVNVDDKPQRVSVAEEPFTRHGATPFIPTNAEAIVNDSIKSGRRDESLKTVETLRANGAGK